MPCFQVVSDQTLRKFLEKKQKNRTISQILTNQQMKWDKKSWGSTIDADFSKVLIPNTGKIEQILQAYDLPKEIVTVKDDALQKHQSNGFLSGWWHWFLCKEIHWHNGNVYGIMDIIIWNGHGD